MGGGERGLRTIIDQSGRFTASTGSRELPYIASKKGAPFWSLLRSMLKARMHGEREICGYMEMGGFREIGGYREVGYIRDMGGYRMVGGLEETAVLRKMGGQREMCSYVACVFWL